MFWSSSRAGQYLQHRPVTGERGMWWPHLKPLLDWCPDCWTCSPPTPETWAAPPGPRTGPDSARNSSETLRCIFSLICHQTSKSFEIRFIIKQKTFSRNIFHVVEMFPILVFKWFSKFNFCSVFLCKCICYLKSEKTKVL